jgi:hypothetical protein
MKRTAGKIFLAILAACLISCTFENDMSYPVIVAEFTSFDVEGDKSVTIDQQNRKIEIVLDEIADLDAVKVTGWSITEGAEIEPVISEQRHSEPMAEESQDLGIDSKSETTEEKPKKATRSRRPNRNTQKKPRTTKKSTKKDEE